MKWKHTLVFALAIFAIGGSVYAVVPLKASAQQWSKASADAGECPAGAQPYNCMDNRAEVPTWHYQDGGTVSMLGGGSGGSPLSPTILGTLKTVGEIDDTITIRGTGLGAVVSVLFNGASATFSLVNSTTITATVPSGATSGPLQLLMNGGLITVGEFTVINTSSAMTIDFRSPALDPRILVSPSDGTYQLNPVTTMATNAMAKMIVTSGRFPPYQSLDYTVRFPWKNDAAMKSFYITSMSSSNGAHALYVDSSGNLTVEILGSTSACTPAVMPYVGEGSEVELRYYYDGIASGGQSVHLRVNGSYLNTAAQWVTCNPSTGPTNLAVPTAFYLGSNLGATPAPDGFSYLLSEGQAHTGVAAVEIVLLGDSLMAAVSNRKAVSTAIYYPSERWIRGGIMSVAQGGDTIANQQSLWGVNEYFGAASVKAVCILLGINDIAGGASSSTVLASLNTLTAYVKANNSGAKVLLSTLLPAKNALTGPQYTAWQAVNSGITGGSVTNVDLVVTSASTELNDGTDALKWWYDFGDGLHENNRARDVVAQMWRDGLVSLGVLP